MTVLERVLGLLISAGRPGLRLGDLIETTGRENFDRLVRP
jgi:hypothetical protein